MRGWSPHAVAGEGRRLVAAALTAVLLLSGLAYAANRQAHHAHRTSLALSVSPKGATLTQGARARLRLAVYQRGYHARVRVRLTGGLPARARLAIAGSSVTVATSGATPPGSYRITLAAIRPPRAGHTGRRHISMTFRLTVRGSGAEAARFIVRGDASAAVAPGASVALDATLQNPNPFAIAVRSLGVAVTQVIAPRADASHPCATSDFATTPLQPAPAIVVPARTTATLGGLQVDPARRPRLAMLDRPSDQSGCKGATLRLSYTGSAARVTR